MRIFDQDGNELLREEIDFEKGYLVDDQIFIEHHEAIEAVEEEGHWETVAEYENGGKDVDWVVDVPAVEAKDAWDEYEDIQVYILYTEEELEARAEAERKAQEEAELQERIRQMPDAAVTWDDLDAAYQAGYEDGYTEGVNSAYDNQ